jgi:hypothetical protein
MDGNLKLQLYLVYIITAIHQPFSHMTQMRTLKVVSFYLFQRMYVDFHVVPRDRITKYKNTILCNCLLFYDYSFFTCFCFLLTSFSAIT